MNSSDNSSFCYTIRDDRSTKTGDREDSFNEGIGSFDCCDVLRDRNKIGEPSEAIQHN